MGIEEINDVKALQDKILELFHENERLKKGACTMVADEERGFEVGKDEAWFANIKRTYDEMQGLSLESARRSRDHFDTLMSDERVKKDKMFDLMTRATENAIETANMTAKQAVRHGDVAVDRTWNVDEQGYTVAKILESDYFKDLAKAIALEVAVALRN